MVLTRAFSVAQLSSLWTACAHHLALAQLRICFNISLVLNFILKIIPMCVESCHLSAYWLSHPLCKFALNTSIPGHTLDWIFEQVHTYLTFVWDSNCKIFFPNKWAAPAACNQSFVNGAIGTWLPSHTHWVDVYRANSTCIAIHNLVLNPGKICKATLSEVHYAYCQPLCWLHIVIEDKMLILRELICGSTSYTRLQIVPEELRNILFVAFHSIPIGGHLNAYCTLHHLRMRYHWPEMYLTLNGCVTLALGARYQTLCMDLHHNSSTIFQMKHPFGCCLSRHVLLANTLGLRAAKFN